ncbi:MFS transporter [Streptomyces sp. Z26]|uniref:MFS transporter n=1 Tax=Streptomyces sp. Z26 TaxID=2500177 RepID=UPI000EF164AE|nr:MFS transporter [Streptomyces sp. Z26]RLL66129.1 MFS transporter [Streptomyces sp. Z26]
MSGTNAARSPQAADVPAQRVGTGAGCGRGTGAAAGDPNRWTVLVVLCASLLLVALDATVLHVAVPAVAADLRPGPQQLLWIVDVYPLVCASLLILFGTLGDRVGRRRVLLFGYALFALASGVAAYAHTPVLLIAARALLGVGGAMIMPATLSILRQVFPDRRERAVAVGVWSAVAAVGAAVGPLFGGLLLEHFWWGSVFLINIPLMAAGLLAGRLLLPESTSRGEGPWDVLGAVMAAAGLIGVIYGVKAAGAGEGLSVRAVLALAAGAVLLARFVRRQRRRPYPLVDIAAIARPAFGTAVGCIVLTVLALVGLALIAAQYLQLVLGLSPLETGLRLLPLSLAAVAAGLTGARLLRLLGPRRMVASGFALTTFAVLCLTTSGQEDRPAFLACCFVLLGFGLEATLFACYESMLSHSSADRAGGAAAVGETAYQLGAGIGIALLGSVMNAAYAPRVRDVAGVPSDARGDASHSLGEAYGVAAHLGDPASGVLLHAARVSFVHGMHMTLLVSAGLLLLGALAALRLPRTMECADPDRDEAADGPGDHDGPGGAGATAAAPGRAADVPTGRADGVRTGRGGASLVPTGGGRP